MIDVNTFLLMMLYILGSILLIVLIVLGIKLIITINKIDVIVDDINGKVTKLNGIFQLIDVATDKLALFNDKIVDVISALVHKIFVKKKNNGKGEEENE